MSKYDEQLFDKINHIDEIIPLKLVQWPICMEVEKDKSWHRYEEDGKHYIVIKEEYYIDGKSLVKKQGASKYFEDHEVREQYCLLWGNINRTQTLAEHEFYVSQMRKNCVKTITEDEFLEIWKQVAESVDEYSQKIFNPLPIDSIHKKNLQKQREEYARKKFNNTGKDTESDGVPF